MSAGRVSPFSTLPLWYHMRNGNVPTDERSKGMMRTKKQRFLAALGATVMLLGGCADSGEEGAYMHPEQGAQMSYEATIAKLQEELARFLEDSARFFGCQFIISTHSPFLLSLKGARIYDLDRSPAGSAKWTELEAVRAYYNLFKSHEDAFKSL